MKDLNDCICAAVQMVSGMDVARNLTEAGRLIEEAAESGANLVVLPENFAFMGARERDRLAHREADGAGPLQQFLAGAAQRCGVWLVGGSIPMVADEAKKVRSACLVYDDAGRRVARYDKIHLFDVRVPDSDERHLESASVEAGGAPLVSETPFGRLGVAICYDLRFPELFRGMARQGMDILALPAAFTARTGAAHWEVLLRARAVENQCYVAAADQGGCHENGRTTFGDSMIVDPWGTVLARLAAGPGVVSAALTRRHLENVRGAFPVLQHRRIGP